MGLITEKVTIKCNSRNKNWYINKGYDNFKQYAEIEVNVKDLSEGSHTQIRVTCDKCGKEYSLEWKAYLKQSRKHDGKIFCNTCKGELLRVTEMNYNNKTTTLKDITGVKYGLLTPVRIDFERIEKSNNSPTYWLCKCDCDNENLISVKIGSLQSGQTTSCGCINNNPYKEDLTGRIFGRLKVIKYDEYTSKITNHNYYLCKCSCENSDIKSIRSSQLKNGEITSCGCYHREAVSGDNSHLWKGGITSENEKIRNSLLYKNWRQIVFERDDYTCQCCENRGEKLQAHHLENFAENTELRLDIDNGITLCEKCHSPNIIGSFHNIYGTHNNTKKQYEEFIKYKNNKIQIKDAI